MPRRLTVEKNPAIDAFLLDGCGRCDLYATDGCKARVWQTELVLLRDILLTCDLKEEHKWKQPCYTNGGKNILILSAFKDYVALSFFDGALLKDPKKVLIAPTKNMQSDRQMRFTKKSEITKAKATIRAYVSEAIEARHSGRKVKKKETSEYEVPDELTAAFKKDAKFRKAFSALTPGRQRGYLIHFADAKQSKTRSARIEKHKPKIFQGLGIFDR